MKRKLTDSELSVLSEQLAMILRAGISSSEGISILQEDAASGEGKKILEELGQRLDETGSLADAMRATELFPEYFIKMTETGERSGTLEEIMDSLSDHYKQQDLLIHSIRDALTYPLILLGMLFAVLVVLMTQVMPVFQKVFEQLGVEVTGVSSLVFQIGSWMQKGSVTILLLVVALVLFCMAGLRTEKGRNLLLRASSHLPIARKIEDLIVCSRFSNALSLALHSGLDIDEGFSLASSLAGRLFWQEKLNHAAAMVEEGADLPESLREAGIFTGLNARLVSIGFRTGTAETALKRISENCQEEAQDRLQSAISTLEPTLTAVLSILTGLILVSVMLPLLGVMTNIG